jgi:hypothetical protein
VSGREDITRDDRSEASGDDECARFEPLLAAHVLGRKSRGPNAAKDARALDMHLASCTSCREVEASLGTIVDGLSGAMLELSSPASARTLSPFDSAGEARSSRSMFARVLPFGTFAAGAAVAASIALFTIGSRGTRVADNVWSAPPVGSTPAEAPRPAGGPCPPPPAPTHAPTETAPPLPKPPEPNEIWVPPPTGPQDPFARDSHGWRMPPMPPAPLPTAPPVQTATPPVFGNLNVNCLPRCEVVVVDGVPRGPSPLVGFRLPAGTHTVIGILNERQNVRSVNVNEGSTTTLAIKGPAPDSDPFVNRR